MNQCLQCGKQTNNPKFCSSNCSAIFNNKNRKKNKKQKLCIICNNPTRNRKSKCCSNECDNIRKYNDFINKWKNGTQNGIVRQYGISVRIRKYLLQKNNYKCSRCGWSQVNQFTNKIPLQIDHIDGNYKNNKQQNLRVLCPNCHSLTQTYKGANRGNGKKSRDKYY